MPSLFEPHWLPVGHPVRWGTGIEIRCPVCPRLWNCRLQMFFLNPCDGMPPDAPPKSQLYYRIGSGFGEISLTPEVDVGEHGRFEIIGGKVIFRLQ